MKSKEELLALFHRFLEGEHTSEELDELLSYFSIKDGNEYQLRKIITDYIAEPEDFDREIIARANHITEQTDIYLYELVHHRQPVVRRLIYWKLYLTVAAIAFSLAVSGVLLYLNSKQTKNAQELTSRFGDDVMPGGNNAVLTLADGRIIALDSVANGVVAEQAGITITKSEDGIISYEAQSDVGAEAADVAANTITTPNGGQYQVILPDGSQVWLNAASSLTYPTRFTGNLRKVQLTGEGYFEVRHDEKHRFVVETRDQQVQVLGTEFNINAYKDEAIVTTTLVTGSILLCNSTDAEGQVLKPGEQATLNDGVAHINQVDVQDYTAWKEGLIVLNRADLPKIIRQVERWYDVEFVIPVMPDTVEVVGELRKDVRLSDILDALHEYYGLNFKIDGRRITARK